MTPEELQKLSQRDQDIAAVSDLWPRYLRGFYDGCIEQGFSEAEALFLTEKYLTANLLRPRS